VTEGLPQGAVGLPEVEYYTFEINYNSHGLCAQFVHDIHFVQPGVRLHEGKKSIGVIAVLDGKIVGSALIDPPPAIAQTSNGASANPNIHIEAESISATVNGGIIGPPQFHVAASVVVPTLGFQVELRPAQPQGINPRILILDLIATPPTGPAGDVVTTLVASYHIDNYSGNYTAVTIRFDHISVTVPVIVIYGIGLQQFANSNLVSQFVGATFVGNG
jgi:hypothetical protein